MLDSMGQLDDLIEFLATHKRVAFAFIGPNGDSSAVSIRESEKCDFDEFGEDYSPGEMFEIGPARPSADVITTQLNFSDLYQAGNAVLRRRAELLGQAWGDPDQVISPAAHQRAG
jgi:hypothetical protein